MAAVFSGRISAGFAKLTGKKVGVLKPARKSNIGDRAFRSTQVLGRPLHAEILEIRQGRLACRLMKHPVKCSLGHSAHFCHFLEADPIPIMRFDVADAFGNATNGVGRDLHFMARESTQKNDKVLEVPGGKVRPARALLSDLPLDFSHQGHSSPKVLWDKAQASHQFFVSDLSRGKCREHGGKLRGLENRPPHKADGSRVKLEQGPMQIWSGMHMTGSAGGNRINAAGDQALVGFPVLKSPASGPDQNNRCHRSAKRGPLLPTMHAQKAQRQPGRRGGK